MTESRISEFKSFHERHILQGKLESFINQDLEWEYLKPLQEAKADWAKNWIHYVETFGYDWDSHPGCWRVTIGSEKIRKEYQNADYDTWQKKCEFKPNGLYWRTLIEAPEKGDFNCPAERWLQ